MLPFEFDYKIDTANTEVSLDTCLENIQTYVQVELKSVIENPSDNQINTESLRQPDALESDPQKQSYQNQDAYDYLRRAKNKIKRKFF
ncbi:hypothetical protein Pse7429DRAFT_3252 [Pseudanabaena biceps PCC 7429]|uniref:Uncharacterized protein n=2 Tax=Pseudanabaena TaxID=1152 RepID=L8MWN1_9CYAN|nr:hypothetical protein Pse7429DRAFT_3252 [Pseudanabaena biceps PCC 7429]